MKIFLCSLVILLSLACSDSVRTLYVPPEINSLWSSVTIIGSGVGLNCFSSTTGTNETAFLYGSMESSGQIREASQSWIDNYFKPNLEDKEYYNGVLFSEHMIIFRLHIPADDSTLIRQAIVTDSEIVKLLGGNDYATGYLYPPNEELLLSWNMKDSSGADVAPGWYAYCTEFVNEDEATLFWFYLSGKP